MQILFKLFINPQILQQQVITKQKRDGDLNKFQVWFFNKCCVPQAFNQYLWETIFIIKALANRIMTSGFDFVSSHLNITPDASAPHPPFLHKHQSLHPPPLIFQKVRLISRWHWLCSAHATQSISELSVPLLNKTENLSSPSRGCCKYKEIAIPCEFNGTLMLGWKWISQSKWIRITFRGNLEWRALPQTHRMHLHRQYRRLMCMSKSVM